MSLAICQNVLGQGRDNQDVSSEARAEKWQIKKNKILGHSIIFFSWLDMIFITTVTTIFAFVSEGVMLCLCDGNGPAHLSFTILHYIW